MYVSSVLSWLAANASVLICGLAAAHLLLFFVLRIWWTGALRKLQDFLEALLRNIPGTSDRRRDSDLDEQIEDFLQDVRAILTQDHFRKERHLILTRVIAKKENRPYLKAKGFERWYNVARSAVEIYPLAGILGTILAMAVSLSPAEGPRATAGDPSAAAAAAGAVDGEESDAAATSNGGGETRREAGESEREREGGPPPVPAEENAVASIVTNFRSAIWSTFWGLLFAILFMGINAWYEPSFARLIEYRTAVREAVREAERGIVLAPDHPAQPAAEGGGA